MVAEVDPAIRHALGAWQRQDEPPTLREFSRRIRLPAGPMKGHYYDPDSCPIQSWFIDQLDGGHWDRFYLCAPPQIGGKSLIGIQIPTLRAAIECRLPVGYALPTQGDLNKAWEEKLKPSIRGAGFGRYLPEKGPGSRQGRPPSLTFEDPADGNPLGRVVFLAGGGYGSTVAVALVDEVDQFRSKTTGEPYWGRLEDIFHRADAFQEQAIRGAMGTIEDDRESIIIPLIFDHGTGTRPHFQCPDCGEYQLLDWSQVSYDDTDEIAAAESVRMACVHCGAVWDERARQDVVAAPLFVHRVQRIEAGQVVGDPPRTRHLGLLWTALDSTLSRLPELAQEHYRAAQALDPKDDRRLPNHELMRKFHRYRLCKIYDGDQGGEEEGEVEFIDARALQRRSSRHGWARVRKHKRDHHYSTYEASPPEAAVGYISAVDLQHNRAYWSMIAVDDRHRTWDRAWGYRFAFPDMSAMSNETELWTLLGELDEIITGLSGELPVFRRLVDIGDREEWVMPWLVRNRSWRAVRGVDDNRSNRKHANGGDCWYDRTYKGGLGVYNVMTGVWEVRVHEAYGKDPADQGAAILPKGLDARSAYIRHLTIRGWKRDLKTGELRWGKTGAGSRDDHFDCRSYASAVNYLRLQTPRRSGQRRRYGVVGKVV